MAKLDLTELQHSAKYVAELARRPDVARARRAAELLDHSSLHRAAVAALKLVHQSLQTVSEDDVHERGLTALGHLDNGDGTGLTDDKVACIAQVLVDAIRQDDLPLLYTLGGRLRHAVDSMPGTTSIDRKVCAPLLVALSEVADAGASLLERRPGTA